MQRNRPESKEAFITNPSSVQTVARWRATPDDFKLLERVNNNWMLEERWLSKGQFRAKWVRTPGAGGILQMTSSVTETTDGRYRPTLYGFSVLVAASSKNCSNMMAVCRKVYAHLRKSVDKGKVGNISIDLDRLIKEVGVSKDKLEKALALLSDSSLGIHFNRIPDAIPTVSAQEYVLQYRSIWEYMTVIVKTPNADWSNFTALEIFEPERRNQYARIFAVVPEGQKHFTKCLDRLDSEPDAAITSARVLVEACLNWIAHDAGLDQKKNKSPAKLFQHCMEAIGLSSEKGHGNTDIDQMIKGMDMALEGLAHLRNNMGDAHARKVGQPVAARPQARLAVLLSIAVSAYLIEAREARKCV